ncbi:MAG: CinA family protein, partial [Clostridia bacterium]|nr:CinA family protein [Clostridia bacterium]
SITGIAGPGGGTDTKPVGLVYIAIADENGVSGKELRLWGDRNRIRSVACLHVFDMIRMKLLGEESIG